MFVAYFCLSLQKQKTKLLQGLGWGVVIAFVEKLDI